MEVTKILKELILTATNNLNSELIKFDHPKDSKFGDFTTNIAMLVAKEQNKNPNEVAIEIKNNIQKHEMIDKVDVVGGYLNFYLSKKFLKDQAEIINYEIEYRNELAKNGQGKTMIIDYSSPNIAKPFGIGHLRSTNIGQSLYNIYKFLGWNCIGDNHLGDWGTQFGKLTVAILNPKWNQKNIDDLSIDDLEKLYVKFHEESKKDDTLNDLAREWFVKLEKGDLKAKEIWQKCINISQKEFNEVYKLLDVNIDYVHGESFYEDKMDMVVKLLEKENLLKLSQGAKIIEFDDMPPAMITKTNGTTTYFTRDLAAINYRIEKWNPDLIIYEVGSDQVLHFKQLFEVAKLLKYPAHLIHVAHGLIRWKTGKFSTRKGDTIHLEEVIDLAMEQAKKIAPDNSLDELQTVAIGAIKFNDLAQDPQKDIIFDWDRVMSMDGNSGPYLQYTYARCQSVLNKTKIKEQKNIEDLPNDINEEELALLKEFYKFEEKIVQAADRFNPAVIAEYILTIARKYNEFYAKHRIIDEAEEIWRIFLTKTTSTIIKNGLSLLGIKTLEKM